MNTVKWVAIAATAGLIGYGFVKGFDAVKQLFKGASDWAADAADSVSKGYQNTLIKGGEVAQRVYNEIAPVPNVTLQEQKDPRSFWQDQSMYDPEIPSTGGAS